MARTSNDITGSEKLLIQQLDALPDSAADEFLAKVGGEIVNKVGGGGGGTPGGSDTEVQFNDGGSFGGDAGMTYNKTTDTLTVVGDVLADRIALEDTNSSHRLYIDPGTDLSADRTFTLTTGDASRTLTMAGDATISGTNTGDQDLSGYVQGPASATDNAIARYNLTTGKIIQDSLVTVSDLGAVVGATQLDVDNIRIDGNTISTTNTNGDLTLAPNGTGDVVLDRVKASGSAGIMIQNSGGTQQAEFGAGGGTNATLNGTTNIGTASADYHQVAGGTGTITDTATGSSTDININLVPKGTGRLQAGGVTVPTISSADTLTNKGIDASTNTITNIDTADFAVNVIDTDGTLAANSDTRLATQKAIKTYADTKVTANGAITGATKTKITYDAKGLVTSGADATTADIAPSTNRNYVTDAQATVIGNTSGTNTGDQTITNSSDATSHTVTLSASGGSVQLIEGTNITLTTGGTSSAGTVTIAASGGGGSGESMKKAINQSSHSLAVGDVVRHNGTIYVKAQADTAANAEALGIVDTVTDANNFSLTLGGYISGLSGRTSGEVYFLSPTTAGALTATAPSTDGQVVKPVFIATSTTEGYVVNMRGEELDTATLGYSFGTIAVSGQSDVVADSVADTLTLAAGTGITLTTNAGTDTVTIEASGGGGGGSNSTQDFRLTLVSGVPVMTSSQTAKTTVYLTPYKGNGIALYDGSSAWEVITSAEVSLSLSGYTASKNYDIWAYNNAGTLTLESTVWTNDSTRATALAYQDGVLVKSGATTRRYIGTIRINSTGGQCDFELGGLAVGGAVQSIYLWNYYNRVPVTTYTGDTTDYWIYTGGWRSANNSATYRVDFIVGVQEDTITASYNCYVYTSGTALVGVAYDATNAFSGTPSGMYTGQYSYAEYRTQPVAGYHYVQAIESGLSGTSYFYGDEGAPTNNQSILRLSQMY